MCLLYYKKRRVKIMLIICPECNKSVSDKAKMCPNCGYPLEEKESTVCTINNIKYDLQDVLHILPKVGNRDTDVHPFYITGMLRDLTPLSPQSAEQLAKIILETKSIPQEFKGMTEIKQPQQNMPKCPTCNSTNIQKISATSKAVNTVAFGLLGTKRHKTFHCNNCKYEW